MCILTVLVKTCKKTFDNKQYYVTFNNNKQRGQYAKAKIH